MTEEATINGESKSAVDEALVAEKARELDHQIEEWLHELTEIKSNAVSIIHEKLEKNKKRREALKDLEIKIPKSPENNEVESVIDDADHKITDMNTLITAFENHKNEDVKILRQIHERIADTEIKIQKDLGRIQKLVTNKNNTLKSEISRLKESTDDIDTKKITEIIPEEKDNMKKITPKQIKIIMPEEIIVGIRHIMTALFNTKTKLHEMNNKDIRAYSVSIVDEILLELRNILAEEKNISVDEIINCKSNVKEINATLYKILMIKSFKSKELEIELIKNIKTLYELIRDERRQEKRYLLNQLIFSGKAKSQFDKVNNLIDIEIINQ
ncbi:MAG: hypothetical protein WC755_01565 [Candidatus Woesearchaeota archaeon]|jgi:hypothetical protein